MSINKKILILISLCSVLSADFIKSDDNKSVYDTSTMLQWEDQDANTTSWVVANTYCEDLNLSNKTDWHLPNINQLFLLADKNSSNPSINSTFTYTNNNNYWSSTTDIKTPENAFSVNFSDGKLNSTKKTESHSVRCVRVFN